MDRRSLLERRLDELVGPPLYYCSDCLRAVKVTVRGAGREPEIERPCAECRTAQIYAPRKAILVGDGGMNKRDRVTQTWRQVAAALTGRCV